MNFTVRTKLGNCRRGVLKVDNQEIETPGCSLYTRGGAVPHLTSDVLKTVQDLPSAVHLSLQTTIDQPGVETIKKTSGYAIKKFFGLEEYVSYLSIQDPIQELREGYNEQNSVSVVTPGGRRKIDVNRFITVLEVFKPNIAECLCDTIPASKQTEKRICRSVDRTLRFLDKCIEEKDKKELASCNLFGVIEGSNSEKERIRSAKETSQRPVAGFVVEGFTSSQCNWNDLLQKTVEVLPNEKPRLIHGIGTPEEVLLAVECGIDLFDSSYPPIFAWNLSERGCALDINWSKKRFRPELTYSPTVQETEEQENKYFLDEWNHSFHENGDKGTMHEIDVNHSRFSCDFSPLVNGCTCYCCTNHTRAYVHHLLVTKEMLATVLLMLHNLHEYCKFFSQLRLSMEENCFKEFKDTVMRSRSLH
ncbi:queuine tRNA-ribosyltransferase accessory subunit 2-like [Montipora capricornis]|uniref:queuine tRNA-ribosyltransferase accessory subunit 2-like n=1 Tax=Montipora capricornis TaxID=246305 RepID=UPI0035F1C570